jgi:hypothetical protein
MAASKEESPQELINKLERLYTEATNTVLETKSKHVLMLQQLLDEQEAQHTALKNLADTKITILVNTLQAEQSKNNSARGDNVKN